MGKTTTWEEKIEVLVQKSVSKAVRNLLTDPDYGLHLTHAAENRLAKSINAKKRGGVVSLETLLKKYQISS